MRILIIITTLWMISTETVGQGFPCDGAIYLISYVRSEGKTRLYRVEENNREFKYEEIELSEDRRLTSLAYNVLDEQLYALDFDTYELVRIDNRGTLYSLGRPEAIDTTLEFHSGTISPDGSGIYMIANNTDFEYDTRFYTVNLSREDLYAGYLGVTGELEVTVHDFATDPLSGIMFGYDNSNGRLVQLGIGGQINSLDYPSTGVTTMDGLFFNQEGELFGFSAVNGMYFINKFFGDITFLGKGIEGTNGDACSCPYTYAFTKDISPREILPCQEFEVRYGYKNQLGIGQTWVSLRDTFPEGFEILSIESSIVSDFNIVDSPPNVLALENLIYLLRDNEIVVKVRAPEDYYGDFGTRAVHWDFPFAFQEYQRTDDPATEMPSDATMARVISPDELMFDEYAVYTCSGDAIQISSPIEADAYEWNTGDTVSSITVSEPGWYSLFAVEDCNAYFDSIQVVDFPGQKSAGIIGTEKIILGDSVNLRATLDRGIPNLYQWIIGSDTTSCMDCMDIMITPSMSTSVSVLISDDEGCTTAAEFDIEVEELRFFYAANSFTPNGDGINDRFFLSSSSGGVIRELVIFNRWGNEVFRGVDLPLNSESGGWDGLLKGEVSPSGVYIWVAEIEYFDGFKENRSGPVTLFANR